MPIITFDGAELTRDQKASLIKEFTDSAAKITKLPPEAFHIILRENSRDNIGAAGKMLSELKK